ncbi:endonuclease MutS2 [Robiginitalea aurantiaca]|uniref:DNA mismatch repair protein MutS n=1 Tax=Robiginitalea aurantiaca TaxID=3056915 RepID=A0ABT7WFH1_9FLAO|nr:DNA mismatch repair protein MutS [Robiginitalea aurantiaca]MDM9631677.1 DNA mismatch repair protein MutS [Robiginitalea aurantiaca]
MKKVSKKTLEDLEFPEICTLIKSHCVTGPGRFLAENMSPIQDEATLLEALERTREYLSSLESENKLPNHGFEAIDDELHALRIENSLLPVEAFRKFSAITALIKNHQRFLKKFQDYFPTLEKWVSQAPYKKEISDCIDVVIDRHGEIKDSASPELSVIRSSIRRLQGKVNQSFNAALSRYAKLDYLDEIRESTLENQRVLAVKAMYRRKVKGSALGTSKTGSIVFIAPEAAVAISRELQLYLLEEKEEIQRILRELGRELRPFIPDLEGYQDVLAEIDFCSGKALLAKQMDATLPEINKSDTLLLLEAYHPLLLLNNKKRGEKTWPQTLELSPENRIIVISGPNAGGKSITLKTIGLLQLMLQSGMLIPVKEGSTCCFFNQILTDIGDHQSIENHLSTYSYRLKNMNRFLRKCDRHTLFLIDEFGTGSDPELGGALAETFLETFYECGAYGVITTHYANLKALADELPEASNANMLFNSTTLEPTFQLEMGQPGSSFTFEVAQKNGIPYSLINKARKKVARGKLRFDQTIAKLQKERNKMARTEDRLHEEESKARSEALKLEALNEKIQAKLSSYQELYDYNQRMIHLGTRIDKAAEKYYKNKKKRPLISDLLRIVETENSKRKPKPSKVKTVKAVDDKAARLELEKEVKTIRKKKKAEKKSAEKAEDKKPKPILKVGDRVRLQDSKSVGSIDRIEKQKAFVNYGLFTTEVSVEQLELVESSKG